MMMQPSITMIKILIFRNYSVFDEPHFLKNLRRKPSSFPSNQRLVSWYLLYFNYLFNLHQIYQGKTKESEYIERGTTQLSVSRSHSCTAIPNLAQKKQSIFWMNKNALSSVGSRSLGAHGAWRYVLLSKKLFLDCRYWKATNFPFRMNAAYLRG